MNNCSHCFEDGRSAIMFNTKKWTAEYPRKIKGICKICKEHIEITEKEYKDFLKEEEYNETY